MRKIGWLVPLVLAFGCQKSPGAFDEGRNTQPEQQQPSNDQQRQQGEYGQQGDQGTNEPGTNEPGMNQQGMNEPGMNEPGMNQPGMNQPGMNQPGMNQPGMNQPGMMGQAPAPIRNLKQGAENIRIGSEFQYTDLAQSLRDLSTAFQALPNAGTNVTDAASRINSFADRIEASGATSTMHARWAKRALSEAVGALEAYNQDQKIAGLDQQIQSLRAQVDQIQEDQALTQIKDMYADSYGQIADTLVMAATMQPQPTAPGTR